MTDHLLSIDKTRIIGLQLYGSTHRACCCCPEQENNKYFDVTVKLTLLDIT